MTIIVKLFVHSCDRSISASRYGFCSVHLLSRVNVSMLFHRRRRMPDLPGSDECYSGVVSTIHFLVHPCQQELKGLCLRIVMSAGREPNSGHCQVITFTFCKKIRSWGLVEWYTDPASVLPLLPPPCRGMTETRCSESRSSSPSSSCTGTGAGTSFVRCLASLGADVAYHLGPLHDQYV